MKYAILGPAGRINRVLDEPNDRTVEITDAQAEAVAASGITEGYFIIGGQFMSTTEQREYQRAQRQAERDAALTPEQLEEKQSRLLRKQVYDVAAAAFESLPKGKQALWSPVRDAVAATIKKGDFEGAKEILQTMPSLYSGMSTDRDKFLALFP